MRTLEIRTRNPHPRQKEFIESKAKRKVIRAGRRGGKTVGASILAIDEFLNGRRILYAAPTIDQVQAFWWEVVIALAPGIEAKIFTKNETSHFIELPGTKQRIRAKTAWNADTLRGDYADLLILDEWQLMNEDAWEVVGAPMLMDNNGDAIFIYTPPSLHSRSVTKARDPKHASKLFKRAKQEEGDRWEAFHFTSSENPHISSDAIEEIAEDMTALSYRKEILAEDIDDDPAALWKREMIDHLTKAPELDRIVVGVDPTGGVTECGIVAAGVGNCNCNGKYEKHGFVLADNSRKGRPDQWAGSSVSTYHTLKADRIVGEKNYGGEMVEHTIRTVDPKISYKDTNSARGKMVRAEPIAALYEQKKVHHVDDFTALEDEMCSFVQGESKWSPNRMDALVFALTELMMGRKRHDPRTLSFTGEKKTPAYGINA